MIPLTFPESRVSACRVAGVIAVVDEPQRGGGETRRRSYPPIFRQIASAISRVPTAVGSSREGFMS